MIPVYVSNGAFITRNNGRDYRHIGKYPFMLDHDGVEFLMYFVWKDEVRPLRSFLKSTRLSFPVMHMDKEIGETLSTRGAEGTKDALSIFRRDLETALEIGSAKLVIHLWNGAFSDSRFDESLDAFAQMHFLASKEGLSLTVENVTCRENLSLDHLLELRRTVPDAHFTFDTKMAYLHRENELLGTEKYKPLLTEGAISHLHVNDSLVKPDMERLPIMHIGDGQVDFDAFFSLVKGAGYKGTATVESTSVDPDGSVDVEKLNRSLRAVRAGLNG